MAREQFIPTVQDAREIIFGDHLGFNLVSTEIIDHQRWSVHSEAIVQRIADSKFFRTRYSQGATESQDERPFEFETPVFTEVIPVQKTITVYE